MKVICFSNNKEEETGECGLIETLFNWPTFTAEEHDGCSRPAMLIERLESVFGSGAKYYMTVAKSKKLNVREKCWRSTLDNSPLGVEGPPSTGITFSSTLVDIPLKRP